MTTREHIISDRERCWCHPEIVHHDEERMRIRADWGWLKAFANEQLSKNNINDEEYENLIHCAEGIKASANSLVDLAMAADGIATANKLEPKEFDTLKLIKRILYSISDLNNTIEDQIEEMNLNA